MIASLISDVSNYQYAALLIGYALLLSALMVSIFGHVAWRVAKRVRPRREVEREARERKRYLDACVGLTEGDRWR
jgi:hypothetical protein